MHEYESEQFATKADIAELKTEMTQLQVKSVTWTTVLAGIIIPVHKLT